MTIVYLTPASDVGDTLSQYIDDTLVQVCHFHRVRLWELDAHTTAASGEIGQIILSLLMDGADEALAAYAIAQVMQQTDMPHQKELVSIVAIFAERVMAPERVLSLIGRKNMMESTIVNTLIEEVSAERVALVRAELEQERERERQERERREREREQERRERERELEQERRERERLQHTLVDAVAVRFPEAPLSLNRDIWKVTETDHLQDLFLEVVKAGDLADFVAVLKTYAPATEQKGSDNH